MTLAMAAACIGTGAAVAEDLPTGAPESAGMSSERLDRLDDVMHGWVDDGHIAGVVTLIARRGRVVHLDAYGMADIENGEPMTRDTYFRLFSMTKPVTSVALLMLYEEGKYQLNEPLARYLPEFEDARVFAGVDAAGNMILEEAERAPTILDVFRHTAGFSYGEFGGLPEALRPAMAHLTSLPMPYCRRRYSATSVPVKPVAP